MSTSLLVAKERQLSFPFGLGQKQAKKPKKYGANAPQLRAIRCSIDFYVMLCKEIRSLARIPRVTRWTRLDLEGGRRGGCMRRDNGIIEVPVGVRNGNDERAVCILCSNQKRVAIGKQIGMWRIAGVEMM